VNFLLRGVLLSMGTFFLVYLGLSLALAALWRLLAKRTSRLSSVQLFAWRVFPLGAALTVSAFLVVPSFLFLEPAAARETISLMGMLLACCGLAVAVFGLASAFHASRKTARFVASCPRTRNLSVTGGNATAVEVAAGRPMLFVAGICHPTLLISEQAGRILEPSEMEVAILHELAHVNFRDNLKKLVLRTCRFPFFTGLERSWMQAAELAADDAAVTDETSAVNLASALVKVARHSSSSQVPSIAMSLVPDADSALGIRVKRLLDWHKRAPSAGRNSSAPVLIAALVVLAAAWLPILHQVHELTELLVR
jgi:hypothetical protein